MPRNTKEPIQQLRASTQRLATYTGPAGELVFDTTKKTLVAQDGATAGGHPLAKESRLIKTSGGIITSSNTGGANTNAANLANDVEFSFDVAAATTAIISELTGGDTGVPGLASSLISQQDGNDLTTGSDGRLFVDVPAVDFTNAVKADDQILSVADNKIQSTFSGSYNPTTGELKLLGRDNVELFTTTIMAQDSVLEDVNLVVDPEGQDPGTYLKLTFRLQDGSNKTVYTNVTSLVDVYTGGNGIDVTGKSISVHADSAGPVTVSAAGVNIAVGAGLKVQDKAGADGKELVADLTAAVSSDGGNVLVIGADGGLYVAPYTGGDGIAIAGNAVAVKLAATGNQIQLVGGELIVPTDYGVLDDE